MYDSFVRVKGFFTGAVTEYISLNGFERKTKINKWIRLAFQLLFIYLADYHKTDVPSSTVSM